MTIAAKLFTGNLPPADEILAAEFAALAVEVDAAVGRIARAPKKVADAKAFAAVGQLAVDMRPLAKRIERMRNEEQEPIREATKAINQFFGALADKLEAAFEPLQTMADSYTRRVAAEAKRAAEDEAAALRQLAEAERAKAAEATGKAAAKAEGKAEAAEAGAEALERQAGQGAAEAVRQRTTGGASASATQRWTFEITDYDKIDLRLLRPYLKREAIEAAIGSMVRVHKGATELKGVRVFEDVKARFR